MRSPTRGTIFSIIPCVPQWLIVDALLQAGADPHYRTDIDETVFSNLPRPGVKREAILAVLKKYGISKGEG